MATANERTLASYEAHVAEYVAGTPSVVPPSRAAWFDVVLSGLPDSARILELGSGSGRDAEYLIRCGRDVTPSDGAQAFVDLMRDKGLPAIRLVMLRDPVPAGYEVIVAIACLLHLTRDQFRELLVQVHGALGTGGRFAFSVKEGEGERWTTVKLGAPRYFCYWTEDGLREVLARTGFDRVEVSRSTSSVGEPFLRVIAATAPG